MSGESQSREGQAVIEVRGLVRRFGQLVALDQVSLSVPRGVVFGLVGENAAGKTTLIRHLIGLLKAQSGSVRVFGLDPVADPVGVLSGVGYLSENRELPEWMRIHEFLSYSQSFYPKWDNKYAAELCRNFELDTKAGIRGLSQGQRAKVALVAALAYRPELLILDEPSTGLDPVVRRDILEAIIRTVADEGRTVFFSSHLLDEVERVSEELAMIAGGRVVLCASMEEIKERHCALTLRFHEPQRAPPRLEGALSCSGEGREWVVLGNGALESLRAQVAALQAQVVEERTPSLEEIFVARASHGHQTAGGVR